MTESLNINCKSCVYDPDINTRCRQCCHHPRWFPLRSSRWRIRPSIKREMAILKAAFDGREVPDAD